MTNVDIRALFPVRTIVITSDSTYAKPTLAWLQGPFWTWYIGWRKELGLDRWTRKSDCDNFARTYSSAAQDCHALTITRQAAATGDPVTLEGLAVGEIHYFARDLGGWHAIVAAVTDQGLVFIEPQNNRRLMLTPDDLATCTFAYF